MHAPSGIRARDLSNQSAKTYVVDSAANGIGSLSFNSIYSDICVLYIFLKGYTLIYFQLIIIIIIIIMLFVAYLTTSFQILRLYSAEWKSDM
jgi:hypothetical protein